MLGTVGTPARLEGRRRTDKGAQRASYHEKDQRPDERGFVLQGERRNPTSPGAGLVQKPDVAALDLETRPRGRESRRRSTAQKPAQHFWSESNGRAGKAPKTEQGRHVKRMARLVSRYRPLLNFMVAVLSVQLWGQGIFRP